MVHSLLRSSPLDLKRLFSTGGQRPPAFPALLSIGTPRLQLLSYLEESCLKRMKLAKGSRTVLDLDSFQRMLMQLRRPVQRLLGGQAALVACALAQMRTRSSFVGPVGFDSEGLYCRRELKGERVLPWLFIDTNRATARSLSLLTPDGVVSQIEFFGATLDLDAFTGSEFHSIGIVYLEGEMLLSGSGVRLARKAKGQGAILSLHLTCQKMVERELALFRFLVYELVDLLFGTLEQMQSLTGLEEPKEICSKLSTQVDSVVLHCPERGIWVGTRDRLFFFPSKRAHLPALFSASFLQAIRSDWSLEKSVELAENLLYIGQERGQEGLEESDWESVRRFYRLESSNRSTRVL